MKNNLSLVILAIIIVFFFSLVSSSSSVESNFINFKSDDWNDEKYQYFREDNESISDLETVKSDRTSITPLSETTGFFANIQRSTLDRVMIQSFLTIIAVIFGFCLSLFLREIMTVSITLAFYLIATFINYLTRNS